MAESVAGSSELTLFLILRAFASGCVALTGIEAVSNGVPAFRPPEAKNARQVLVLLGVVLISLFVGITFLANGFGLTPTAAGDYQLPARSARLWRRQRPLLPRAGR